ncbi:MAG: tRNA pseudouridine(38-40) synthase TruA [Dehalococcoidia bacterium]|nr:tRNA pseudouridine(38-40) synthase TruA [Dehalococcoidia bacterium]
MQTKKIALIIEYEGTRYHGFQIQAGVPTIQGEIERALRRVTGERIRIASASRTDVGVHAKGQVVTFRTASPLPPQTFLKALNHYLPEDIAVREAFGARDNFDARSGALSREYCYYLLNSATPSPLLRRSAYFMPRPLDIEAMNDACQALLGTHDFAPFASSLNGRKNTVRTIYKAEVVRENELVIFHMVANSFLPHQVRNTMGALVKVGLGKSDVAAFREILRSKKPAIAGPALPPHGLCLMKVNYPFSNIPNWFII